METVQLQHRARENEPLPVPVIQICICQDFATVVCGREDRWGDIYSLFFVVDFKAHVRQQQVISPAPASGYICFFQVRSYITAFCHHSLAKHTVTLSTI